MVFLVLMRFMSHLNTFSDMMNSTFLKRRAQFEQFVNFILGQSNKNNFKFQRFIDGTRTLAVHFDNRRILK